MKVYIHEGEAFEVALKRFQKSSKDIVREYNTRMAFKSKRDQQREKYHAQNKNAPEAKIKPSDA